MPFAVFLGEREKLCNSAASHCRQLCLPGQGASLSPLLSQFDKIRRKGAGAGAGDRPGGAGEADGIHTAQGALCDAGASVVTFVGSRRKAGGRGIPGELSIDAVQRTLEEAL